MCWLYDCNFLGTQIQDKKKCVRMIFTFEVAIFIADEEKTEKQNFIKNDQKNSKECLVLARKC